MTEASLDIAAKKIIRKSKPTREVKAYLCIRSRLAKRLDHLLPQLNPFFGLLTRTKANPKRLPLPGRIDGQQYIGIARAGVLEDVTVKIKVEPPQGLEASDRKSVV